MASESDNKRKCFNFIWKLENASYWWKHENLISPSFIVEEICHTNWELQIDLDSSFRYWGIRFYLNRLEDNKIVGNVAIDCEFAFLSSGGTVLHSWEKKNTVIQKNTVIEYYDFPSRDEVFLIKRSVFLSEEDTLTVRCRIWKSVGEMSKNVQCFARTCIAVEKISFLWNIDDFVHLESNEMKTYEVKSTSTGEKLMSMELFLTAGIVYGDAIRLKITSNLRIIKFATLQLSIIDASKKTVKCFQDEFCDSDACDSKYFTLVYTKSDLMENNSVYLPHDDLSLSFDCAFCYGNIEKGIETTRTDCTVIDKKELDNCNAEKVNELPIPKGILINDFKSMLNNSIHSDIKLKTGDQTYSAHKCILCVRSPVFNAMFASNMKEKINDCVVIEDFSDDTILRMLRYIYSADVKELEWVSATELYEAADKYQILNLKDICSSYLKSNLVINNACEALLLADLHQDDDLKGFVQKFIMSHGKDVINSEAWKQLAETNLKLAYETTLLKFTD